MKFYIPPDKREQDSDIFPYDNKNDNNKRLRTEQQGRLLYTEPLFHQSFLSVIIATTNSNATEPENYLNI